MAGTRFQQAITIGAPVTALGLLAASVLLYVYGGIQVRGPVAFMGVTSELTMSGSTNTVITSQATPVNAMTATGAMPTALNTGNGRYPTFKWANPKTQSASLLSFCLNVFTAPSPTTTTNCFINREDTVGSGANAVYLFKNLTLARGTFCADLDKLSYGTWHQSGSYLRNVGPDEQIKCSNSVGGGSGQNLVGDGEVRYRTNRL